LRAYGEDSAGLSRVAEIGEIVSGTAKGRMSESQVTVATLSGLAVQDIAMASAVLSE
jgi:ornithine cyclodeaminase